jgi:eukaryotic-like serine/threonine-protein kinase
VPTFLASQLTAALGPGYTLERELTGGGMSRVFVAFDAELQRRVAVKVLPDNLAATVSVERFKREILLSAGLQHPHIVGVLSAGEAAGLPFFVMPYVEGESLATRIAERGALGVRETLSILKDVVRALAYAHERGVVHRDIKPHNILLAAGAATVTDFGVAKALGAAQRSGPRSGAPTLTGTGTSLGTPLYMAPEQAAADPDVDHRADIYAVGITAFEMLTGQPPFAGMNPRAMLAARMTQDPPSLGTLRHDVPVALARLVMRCLAREPADRPQTAAEILAALDDPAMASGEYASSDRRHGGLRGRSGWLARAASLVAAAALIGMGGWSVLHRAPSAAPPPGIVAAPVPLSVVVLPLVNIGMDSANNAVADGITSELAAALGRVRGVRVVSPSRAAQLLKAGKSPSEVGEALHVTMQIEGTIQRDGRRLRVTARLVDVSDGTMRWSDMYERETTDLMTVQDELSRAITLAVGEVMRGAG